VGGVNKELLRTRREIYFGEWKERETQPTGGLFNHNGKVWLIGEPMGISNLLERASETLLGSSSVTQTPDQKGTLSSNNMGPKHR